MTIKEQLTLASGLAVALSSAALWGLYAETGWFWPVLGAVAVVTIAGLVGRRLGLPRLLQPLLGLFSLGAYLAVVFAGSTLDYGVVPTGSTVDLLQALVTQGRLDIVQLAPPVPPGKGLVLLSAAGVGGIAVLVDLIAVVLNRAAVAGLPLLVLFAVPSAVLPGGLGGVPFVLGAIGWLGLLMVEGSERVGRWGTPMPSALPGARPVGDDSSLGRVGRRIGFAAVGMAVVVPLLVPGLEHRLIGGGEGALGGGSGSNSQKTYNPITKLKDQLTLPKPSELLLYQTNDPSPDYLRMTTLDRYTGDGWEASDLSAFQKESQVQKGIERPIGDNAERRDLTMRIAIVRDHLDVFWLPVPFGPTKIDVEGTWLWDTTSQTVFSAQRSTRDLPAYDVEASRPLPDRDALALAEAGGVPPVISKKYGKPISVAPYVQALTDRITADHATAYDKAVALQAFFSNPSNGFVYDFNASQPQRGEDALQAFLEGRHGFCEQYATAMAAMLRVAGIPSRVAVGFTPGVLVEGSRDTYVVTTNEAHAWPEAWFAGTGWVRFEPTPAASGARVPDYSVPANADPTTPGQDPSTVVPTPTASPQPGSFGKDLDLLERDPAAAAPGTGGGPTDPGPSRWLIVPVALAVLLTLPFLLSVVRRRHRWSRPGLLTAWAQLQDDATDVGYRWNPADSPRAAANRLLACHPLPTSAAEALGRIALATEQARYAPPGRQQGLESGDATLVRSALQQTATTRVRLRAKYFPPSTVQWAAHVVSERVADLLDTVDDAISRVTRPIRRRTSAAR